jgi:hypothetical protein
MIEIRSLTTTYGATVAVADLTVTHPPRAGHPGSRARI